MELVTGCKLIWRLIPGSERTAEHAVAGQPHVKQ
jgi:hypothetical protein